MTLDLQNWTDVASTQIPQFTENLVHLLPGLKNHVCYLGYEGGFVERLKRGTYMAHILEHIALELSSLAGIGVNFGKTRYAGRPGLYEVTTRYSSPKGMQFCLENAVKIAKSIAEKKSFDLDTAVEDIKEVANRDKLGPSTQALIDAAKKRNIPYRFLANNSLIQFGYGKNSRRLQTAVSDRTSLIAADIAQDKELTKKILKDNFIPVPNGVVVSSLEEVQQALEELSAPYVVKPLNGNHGRGVSLNLNSQEEVIKAYTVAKNISSNVIIEEMCKGRDYRLLVVHGKMIAAAERIPPLVIGDGVKTLQQLIDDLNQDPLRQRGHDGILTYVEPDQIMQHCLQRQNFTLDSVPEKDLQVILRENCNLSSGGTAVDITDKVHPDIVTLSERVARVVGLDICGIDLIHHNIEKPLDKNVKIIEVNAGPGLRMHLAPSVGPERPVGDYILNGLFPNEQSARIPIVSVTGTNGKTTVVRMLHKVFSQSKRITVGMTTTDGIWIGEKKIFSGDTTGPQSSRIVLSDPSVDMAVLEVARGGLLRGGLAYDWSDVSIVTNVRADHVGQDGIENVDDLLWIKSVVAERVRKGGTLVLNADDATTLQIRHNSHVLKNQCSIFLYSLLAQNQVLQEHIATGGNACWVDGGIVHLRYLGNTRTLFKISEIPATLNGIADFQISNVLSVIAAAIASGVDENQLFESLKAFAPTEENLGRLNIYRVKNGFAILDYGHNEDAILSIGKMLTHMKGYSKTVVLGLPGDRSSQLIENTGRAASVFFDKFILRDDMDLRGRRSGEVPAILQNCIQFKRSSAFCKIILNEAQSIQHALETMENNEIVVIFYENIQNAMKVLKEYDPFAVNMIPHLLPLPEGFHKNHITPPQYGTHFYAAP